MPTRSDVRSAFMMNIKQTYETDILVVGGGVAGLMAAIAAAGNGVRVLIAEKADTRRSGSGASGNDHFRCYIPECHGPDVERIVYEVLHFSQVGQCHDPHLTRVFLKRTEEIVRMWERWGIPMRPTGTWEFTGHAYPGRVRSGLKYDGKQQKKIMTAEARKRGVVILNHHPVIELIRNGDHMAGAVALDVSREEPELCLIAARHVILTAGCTTRLYNNMATPGWMFNLAYCPSNAGGGIAQAWRAGAKLVNLEMTSRHAGPKYFQRCGKGTWIGVLRYPDGRPLGPFVTKPDRECGDITSDVWNSSFTDVMRNGTGPAYMDCSQLSDDDYRYMMWGMESEGLKGMLNYMEEAGIDPRRHAVEFMQYEPFLIGRGLEINEHAQCSIPGLYAAGDLVGNFRADIAGAAVFGWIAGEHSGANVRPAPEESAADLHDSPVVERVCRLCTEIMERKNGCPWKEGNLALQQIMTDYAPSGPHTVRSANLLNAGLKYLNDLRQVLLSSMGATCSHTLMRALETLDLIDVGEALMYAARERRETRPPHNRADFPFTNPMLGELFLTIRKENGSVVTEWRKKNTAR